MTQYKFFFQFIQKPDDFRNKLVTAEAYPRYSLTYQIEGFAKIVKAKSRSSIVDVWQGS